MNRRAQRGARVASVGERVQDRTDAAFGEQAENSVHVVERAVHATVGDQAHQVQRPARAFRRVEGFLDRRQSRKLAGIDRLGDAHDVHVDDPARAQGHVADLGVAHLTVGEPDGGSGGLELRARAARAQLREERRVRERRRVTRAAVTEAESVEHDEHDRTTFTHEAAPAECSTERASASPQSRSSPKNSRCSS